MEHTIKAPALVKSGEQHFMELTGKRVYFKIGGQRIGFLIHTNGNEKILTHFASGGKVGSITKVKIRYSCGYTAMPDRTAAQLLIDELCERYGNERVLEIMNREEKINP